MGTPVLCVRRIALATRNAMVVALATSQKGPAIARTRLLALSVLIGHAQYARTMEHVFQEKRASLVSGSAPVL